MRRTADQLNRSAVSKGKEKSAKAGEHILICLWNASDIRAAARITFAFDGAEDRQIRICSPALALFSFPVSYTHLA